MWKNSSAWDLLQIWLGSSTAPINKTHQQYLKSLNLFCFISARLSNILQGSRLKKPIADFNSQTSKFSKLNPTYFVVFCLLMFLNIFKNSPLNTFNKNPTHTRKTNQSYSNSHTWKECTDSKFLPWTHKRHSTSKFLEIAQFQYDLVCSCQRKVQQGFYTLLWELKYTLKTKPITLTNFKT